MIIKRTSTRPTEPKHHRGFLIVRTVQQLIRPSERIVQWASVRNTDDLSPTAWAELVGYLSPQCCGEWTICAARG